MKYKIGDRVEYFDQGIYKGTITDIQKESITPYCIDRLDRIYKSYLPLNLYESKEIQEEFDKGVESEKKYIIKKIEEIEIKKEKHTVGRPLKFRTVEELEEKIEEYKQWVEDNDKPLTIERLACFLESDRDTILNYGKLEGREQFFGTIKKIKSYILADKTERLNSSDGNKAGVIFDLKNNHGFKDRSETEHSTPDGKPFQIQRKNLSEKEIEDRILELTQKFNLNRQ